MFKELAVLSCLFLRTIATKDVATQSVFHNISIRRQIPMSPIGTLEPETHALFTG